MLQGGLHFVPYLRWYQQVDPVAKGADPGEGERGEEAQGVEGRREEVRL